ncbi:PAS domain S-box protein [Pedobacter immunditicola]|uniref:PAS domain S-box protein n=1 Tax=Pedobacter immunditicola TaxID=3133440 RepID=UPI0030B4A8F8
MLKEKELAHQFDNLCKLAALICTAPQAVLFLVEGTQLVLKASFGLNGMINSVPPDFPLSSELIIGDDMIEFAANDPHDQFKQRFYIGTPLVDEQGIKLGALCVSFDQPVSLNKEQQEAISTLADQVLTHLSLQETELELQQQRRQLNELLAIAEIAPEIHAVLDFSGAVLYVNSAVIDVLGYTVEETRQLPIWNLCHEDDLPKLMQKLNTGLQAGQMDFRLEVRMMTKNGGFRWISWNIVVSDDRWYIYGRDVTDSKKVESDLLNLSFVASKVNNAIVINDANDHVTWVNAAFEKITGFTLDDLKGKRLGDLISGPNTDFALIETARQLNKQNQSFSLDLLAYRKDKKPIWVSIYNTLLFDDQGQASAEVEIIIDITDKKLAEQEMMEAKEQALQLSEAKEMFLSVMSHEIRTPLNAILGMTQLLLENDPQPSQIDDLNILKFSGDNLLHIVNDILDFNKMETGNLQLEHVPFSLRVLLQDMLNSLQVNVSNKQNTLRLVYDDSIPCSIMGDKTRLYQVLMNLLGNALKFTEQGSIELTVKLEKNNEHHVVVYFEVKDDGIGIPEDKLSYIFESFTQAKSDIARHYGGTGLGLAITKKILKLYGAEIMVQSREGEGSVFSFYIAFDKVSPNHTTQPAAEEVPAVFHNKKILVVDDNEINVIIAKRLLSKWGLLIESACCGMEALDKVQNGLFDLVLMDLKMPDMNGYEVTKLVRNMDGDYFKSLPVVALSATPINDDDIQFKESGMNGHMMKPLDMRNFKRQLLEFLS